MTLLSVADAYATIMEHRLPLATEEVPLEQAAGRILAQTILADRDYPPISRATMDGIAVSAATKGPWRIEATLPAGHPANPLRDTQSGGVQIMTGAEVPANADAVVPVEDIQLEGDTATLREGVDIVRGQNIHAKAFDRKRGDQLLEPGARLDAPRIAILAATGHARVRVARPPRVAILTTGSEVVPVDHPDIQPAQVRASNNIGLQAGLRLAGITDFTAEHIPDDEGHTINAIARALESCDLLLLSGGVSKGKFDYVPGALRQAGTHNLFHGVAQRPGKPLWFGRTETARVFGLPGNPVSTLTVFRRYVLPFIQLGMGMTPGEPVPVALATGLSPHPKLTLLTPCTLHQPAADAPAQARPVEYHGSGDLTALATSHGFVQIEPGSSGSGSFFAWHAG